MGPTCPSPPLNLAPKVDDPVAMYLEDIYTVATNLAGLPGMSIPCGMADNKPVGLQIIGNYFDEARMLNVAHQYQKATDWHDLSARRSLLMSWDTVIGLEIHVQLATKTKIFSGASTAYGAEPNTQACAIDLAMPGTLPVLNKQAVNYAIMFGLAIDAEIGQVSAFERKNYFYPDSPKGYQTTQLERPIVGRGNVEIQLADGQTKNVRIHHAHLEEDAGKSLHEGNFTQLFGYRSKSRRHTAH